MTPSVGGEMSRQVGGWSGGCARDDDRGGEVLEDNGRMPFIQPFHPYLSPALCARDSIFCQVTLSPVQAGRWVDTVQRLRFWKEVWEAHSFPTHDCFLHHPGGISGDRELVSSLKFLKVDISSASWSGGPVPWPGLCCRHFWASRKYHE